MLGATPIPTFPARGKESGNYPSPARGREQKESDGLLLRLTSYPSPLRGRVGSGVVASADLSC
jgi:hypothetical protein